MANKRLTDLTEKLSATDNAYIHIVEPADISQNPAGSSYKIKKSNFVTGGSGSLTTTVTTITSTNLTRQDATGLATYLNGLPSFNVPANDIRKYFVSDTMQVFELKVRGVNIGSGETPLTANDIIEIKRGDKRATKRSWIPVGHIATTITSVGTPALTITGTLSADPIDVTPNTKFTKTKKVSAISASTAGSPAGWRNAGVYSAALTLDSEWEVEFYSADTSDTEVTDKRLFIGMRKSLAAIGNVDPSTIVGLFGFGCDGADTNYQIMHALETSAATKINLGASFVKAGAKTDFFYIKFVKLAGERIISYLVKNTTTGALATGNFSYTSSRDSDIYLEQIHINNNTTASPVRIGFGEISVTNYY